MGDAVMELNLSEARTKLTQLDKLLKPGESLLVNKRGKPYEGCRDSVSFLPIHSRSSSYI